MLNMEFKVTASATVIYLAPSELGAELDPGGSQHGGVEGDLEADTWCRI